MIKLVKLEEKYKTWKLKFDIIENDTIPTINDMLIEVISKNAEQISKIVLATEIRYNEDANYQEFSINGEKLLVALKKA